MFLSTFELLSNVAQLPRIPNPIIEQLKPISREVLQGYFLTLSNLDEDNAVDLKLIFTVVTANAEDKFDEGVVSSFFDADGTNKPLSITAISTDKRSIVLTLPPKDTGLLLVQPNPFKLLNKLSESEIEIRGYVEIEYMRSQKSPKIAKILATPEQRGTFYQLDIPTNSDGTVDREAELSLASEQNLDQIAYSLPTAKGGSLLEIFSS